MEPYLLFLGAIFGSGGAGALSVKYMLNGSREAIKRIESHTESLKEDVKAMGERVAKIEGKIGL